MMKEILKRKEGIIIGAGIGLGLFYLAKNFWSDKMSVVIMAAEANPTIVSSVMPADWRVMLGFVILCAFIGGLIDKK